MSIYILLETARFAILALAGAALVTNLLVCFAIQILHLFTILRPARILRLKRQNAVASSPFVSVHVPTYNEPAEIVIATLHALANLDYPHFEVLVLDNNTADPAVYEPVQRICASLGERFHFHHFDNVAGAKAGALNLGLELSHPEAEYVAIIDADYQVTPDFLALAARNLADPQTAFVQFPQAYRGVVGKSAAVEEELSDYFKAFALRASDDRSVLLTGTLSVINIDVLKSAGGWNGETVTEDAELGVRLFLHGKVGKFVPAIVGRGLLPLSLASLTAQRRRWVAGNVQTLITTFTGLCHRRWNTASLSIIAQLTAWPAFWLVPAICLLGAAPVADASPAMPALLELAAATIVVSAAGVALRLLINAVLQKQGLNRIPEALVVKLALVWTSSTAFLPALMRQRILFVRTPKQGDAPSAGSAYPELILGVAGVATMIFYAQIGALLPALACALIIATIPAGWWVDQCLNEYAAAIAPVSKRT